jgi:hypothetical protein
MSRAGKGSNISREGANIAKFGEIRKSNVSALAYFYAKVYQSCSIDKFSDKYLYYSSLRTLRPFDWTQGMLCGRGVTSG